MITNKRKILRRSGEGEKGRYLPWSKEEEVACKNTQKDITQLSRYFSILLSFLEIPDK